MERFHRKEVAYATIPTTTSIAWAAVVMMSDCIDTQTYNCIWKTLTTVLSDEMVWMRWIGLRSELRAYTDSPLVVQCKQANDLVKHCNLSSMDKSLNAYLRRLDGLWLDVYESWSTTIGKYHSHSI